MHILEASDYVVEIDIGDICGFFFRQDAQDLINCGLTSFRRWSFQEPFLLAII